MRRLPFIILNVCRQVVLMHRKTSKSELGQIVPRMKGNRYIYFLDSMVPYIKWKWDKSLIQKSKFWYNFNCEKTAHE